MQAATMQSARVVEW